MWVTAILCDLEYNLFQAKRAGFYAVLYWANSVSHFPPMANSVRCCININENANSHSQQMSNKWYQKRHLRESNLFLVIADGVLQPSVLIGLECLATLHRLAHNLTGTFVSTPIRMPVAAFSQAGGRDLAELEVLVQFGGSEESDSPTENGRLILHLQWKSICLFKKKNYFLN